ncbi:hypothetical protein [Brevundimonas sp. NPDC058933]|uniref:hypothetical protein n=1 Tax=Brevundimonas sp. NPDC058933 TaxID=3346673 RepID=UPI003BEEC69B
MSPLEMELATARVALFNDKHTVYIAQMMGHCLTYKGQPVTSLQAFDQARADFDARVASANARHRRDKLERLRDWDAQRSELLHQLWAMIRGRL